MANVRKRNDNNYQIRVFCGMDSTGRRVEKSKTWKPPEGMTPRQIDKELERQKVLFEQEVKQCASYNANITFEEFSKKWIDEYAYQKLAPMTLSNYKYFLIRINKAIGHIKLVDIKPVHLNSFYNNLREKGVKHDPHGHSIKDARLSPKTVQGHHKLISNILSSAVKWQLIEANVANRVDAPKLVRKELNYLDEQQTKILLALLDDVPIQYKTMIKLLLYSGLRRGELMGLEWKDINLDTGLLHVVRSSQYVGDKTIITKAPKTFSSIRKLTLSKSVCDMLREYKRWQNSQRLQLGDQWIDIDRLFTTWNGAPMYPDTLSKWFVKFLKKNEDQLPKVTLHSLRHSNATLMISEGVDICTVSKRLGHADTSTTLNVYAHALQSRDSEAAEKLESALAF